MADKTNKKENDNVAINAETDHKSFVEEQAEYVENFDILETINNVGNDEVFTPRKVCCQMLDCLPEEVWHNPNFKWLNPCSKNGVFEREIALRLDKGLEDVITDVEKRRKHILQDMIYSIGLTKFTSHVARRTLYYCSQANRKCDGIKALDGHYVNGYAIANGSWFDTSDGNVLTPDGIHKFEKDKCIYCGIGKTSKYVDPLQREQYAYEFIHEAPEKLLRHLQDRFFKGDRNMKFDIIIGNPPYQLSDGGGTGASSRPIYQLFIQQAISLNPKYLSMIIPARWYSGGKGLDEFRDQMLNDNHLKLLYDYENFRDVFPSVDLAGGACYFLRDINYSGKCNVINYGKSGDNSLLRPLNQYPLFIRSNLAIEIVNKIKKQFNKFLDERISVRLPFGIPTTYLPKDSGTKCYFTQKIGVKFVDPNDIVDSLNALNKYKLLIPKAPIAGQTDFSKPVAFYYDGNVRIAKPGTCCSESWLIAGMFDTEDETINFKTYIFTKVVRFLLLQTVVSQNITRKNFCFVPELNKYDMRYTDEYLCKKWGITEKEYEYISSKIGEIDREVRGVDYD